MRLRTVEALERLDLHRNTIRTYEEIGLLNIDRNPDNNYRVFDEADLEWIECLKELIHDRGYERKSLARMLELNDCWEVRGCSEIEQKNCRWAKALREQRQ